MKDIWNNPLFGIVLTIGAFEIGRAIAARVKHPIANPLLIAMLICFGWLKLFRIPMDSYMKGARFIEAFLIPSTAVLGLSVYRQRKILKEQFFPILTGCFVGSLISMGSTVILCRMLALNSGILHSLLPKSVTTAIALDLSSQMGGVKALTIMAVILCGVGGAILHPLVIRLLKLSDPVAIGVAFGTASHAVGTARALEMGEVEGAVSGVAMGVAGICTVVIALLVQML